MRRQTSGPSFTATTRTRREKGERGRKGIMALARLVVVVVVVAAAAVGGCGVRRVRTARRLIVWPSTTKLPISRSRGSTNQPINQPINQSTNQPINQSINQSINRSINQSIHPFHNTPTPTPPFSPPQKHTLTQASASWPPTCPGPTSSQTTANRRMLPAVGNGEGKIRRLAPSPLLPLLRRCRRGVAATWCSWRCPRIWCRGSCCSSSRPSERSEGCCVVQSMHVCLLVRSVHGSASNAHSHLLLP
jgi:hypothetical protein